MYLGRWLSPVRHVALCYTPHCTPGSSPYAYKRKDQGPLREGWPRRDEDETRARLGPLAPSPAWTLVTPYCKRTRPGRGTNTKAAGFPPLSRRSPAASLSPFALGLALDPSGLGHAATFTRRPRDPRSRNADNIIWSCMRIVWLRRMTNHIYKSYGFDTTIIPQLSIKISDMCCTNRDELY
jgi:hypothetical protein